MSAVTVRLLAARDITAVLEIQTNSPAAAQWSQSAYENLHSAGEQAWIAEQEGCVTGFFVARALVGEMEILNLAVAPSARRKGVGRALFGAALSWATSQGATRIFLEVRASNTSAILFYRQEGFRKSGVRNRYYSDPPEDALILSRILT